MLHRTLTSALVAFAITRPTSAPGASRAYTQQELCALANQVVIGTVRSRISEWNTDGTTIVTTVTLSVERAVVGSPGTTVSVRTLGGTIGTATQHVGEEPAMLVGSRYLLLMNKQPERPALLIGGVGARRLAAEAAPRTDEEVAQEWEEACAEADPPRTPRGERPRPS